MQYQTSIIPKILKNTEDLLRNLQKNIQIKIFQYFSVFSVFLGIFVEHFLYYQTFSVFSPNIFGTTKHFQYLGKSKNKIVTPRFISGLM